jgi:mRNA interferase MazF
MVTEYVPDTGDLIKLDLGQVGYEQAGWRSALVLSPRGYKRKTRLAVVVVPVTNSIKLRGTPSKLNFLGGLKISGTILSDAVRSIDWGERHARYFDKAPAELRIAALLGLTKF